MPYNFECSLLQKLNVCTSNKTFCYSILTFVYIVKLVFLSNFLSMLQIINIVIVFGLYFKACRNIIHFARK